MKERSENITRKVPALAALALIVAIWELVCVSGAVPSYMLPSPIDVVRAFADDFPNLMHHAATTLQEAAWGLLAGIGLALIMATLMDRFLILDNRLPNLFRLVQAEGSAEDRVDAEHIQEE